MSVEFEDEHLRGASALECAGRDLPASQLGWHADRPGRGEPAAGKCSGHAGEEERGDEYCGGRKQELGHGGERGSRMAIGGWVWRFIYRHSCFG